MKKAPLFALLVGGWCLLVILRWLFHIEVFGAFWILTLAFDGALLASGLALIVGGYWALSRSQKGWRALVVIAVISLGSFAYLTDVLEDAGTRFRF